MSTAADKLLALNAVKAELFAATAEKGLDTTGRTLENLHELWGGISGGGNLQAKSAVPSNVDVEVTPDAGYAALSAVNIAAALNLKPWNIRKGKTLFGITGTAEIAVTNEVPSDIPAQPEDADEAYKEAVGEDPVDSEGNALDMMTLADDDGNITYGYFLAGEAGGTCLYNDVELPDINTVWTDKATYPYAYISRVDVEIESGSIHGYYLYLSDTAGYRDSLSDVLMIPTESKVAAYFFADGASQYVLESSEDSTKIFTPLHYPASIVGEGNVWDCRWCNTDICGDDGDTTVYLAASDPVPAGSGFTITKYDPITTDFAAVGWRRLSYHTTGELAGQWTYDDFSTKPSGGWNYLKNIIQCSREKLYYNGVEVWPNCSQTWSYNGVELPALPKWDRVKYPYAFIIDSYLYVTENAPAVVDRIKPVTFEIVKATHWSGGTARAKVVDNAWEAPASSDIAIVYATPTWSNTDIVDEDDGIVYLAASNPVPV